jgi:DNA polymerase elongation subunit (family B)
MSRFYTNVSVSGNQILYRGYENGERKQFRVDYKPTLFAPSKDKSKWQSLDGMYVEKVQPGTIYDSREFVKKYDGVSGFKIYGDINSEYQFVSETFKGDVQYDFSSLKMATIDIETTAEFGFPDVKDPQEKIIAITIRVKDEIWSFGLGQFNIGGQECYCYDEEEDLINSFLDFWHDLDADIVTGWNVRFFDIPYLYKRIHALMGKKMADRLSPWKRVREQKIHRMNREHLVMNLHGIEVMDYLDLYRSFTYEAQENYRLDHIAYVELDERKLSYEEFDNLVDFYKSDFQKFMEYNVKDVELVHRLEDKLQLMELAIALAYSAKVNYIDVFSQVRMWDVIIYNYLHNHNIVIPPRKGSHKSQQYEGAYVKDIINGMHDWVVSFDLNSLYPHLIMQYNISPETKITLDNSDEVFGVGVDRILEGKCIDKLSALKEKGYSVAANGSCFTKEHMGFLPALMEKLYEERKIAKKNMLDAQQLQQDIPKMNMPNLGRHALNEKCKKDISKYKNQQLVRKVQLNSAYGAIGNQYCRYYDVEMAEAITISGQLSIRWIEKELNSFLNKTLGTDDYDYVVAIDTDSVYLRLGTLVDKMVPTASKQKVVDFLDKSCEEIMQPIIDRSYEELADLMNAYQQKMFMGREVIADKGIWTAKKRYILNVLDSEGVRYTEPYIKVMGIETIRSSTPEAVRNELKKAIKLIINTDEDTVIDFVEKAKNRFDSLPPEDIAFPRTVRKMKKYHDPNRVYASGCPIAVKGALIYNHLLKKLNIKRKYTEITNGEKVKFIYLNVPNPIKEKVISFSSSIPKEFDLSEYIDYELQFEKAFIDPIKSILDAIGWHYKKESTLESLFA